MVKWPLDDLWPNFVKPARWRLNTLRFVTTALTGAKQYTTSKIMPPFDLECPTLKNRYVKDIMTKFQEHRALFVAGDTF